MKEKVLRSYESIAERFNEQIDLKPHNAFYDRPNVLGLLGPCKDMHILDAACGPGKYAEELLQGGAHVTGFDFSPKMIEMARRRNGKRGTFFVHDLEAPLQHVPDASFDAVICALALHYMETWDKTMMEFHRVLKPTGRLIVSMEHPFFDYTYYKSDKYFEIEPVKCHWKGFGASVEMNSYRRPLAGCLMPLIDCGFHIDTVLEPLPTREFKTLDPKHYEDKAQGGQPISIGEG